MIAVVNKFVDSLIEEFCEHIDLDSDNHIIVQGDAEVTYTVTAWIRAFISKERLSPLIVFKYFQPLFTWDSYTKVVAPALFVVYSMAIMGISESTFPNPSHTTSIDIPAKVGNISIREVTWKAFADYTNLKDIKIASGIKGLSSSVFEGCRALKHVDLPSSIKYVGTKAFKDCINLETIRMPAVEQVNEGAFANCFKLVTIYCDIPKTARKLKREYRSVHIICNGVEIK